MRSQSPSRTASAGVSQEPPTQPAFSSADEPLIAGLREVVYQRSTAPATRSLRIEPSRLGEQAGLTGCAAMALDNVLSPEAINMTAH